MIFNTQNKKGEGSTYEDIDLEGLYIYECSHKESTDRPYKQQGESNKAKREPRQRFQHRLLSGPKGNNTDKKNNGGNRMNNKEIAKALIEMLKDGCTTHHMSCPANIARRYLFLSGSERPNYRDSFCHRIFPELKNKPLDRSDDDCGLCPCNSDIGIDEIMRRLIIEA